MRAVLKIRFAGPQVTIQDAGRFGFLRYGVPASGPMDRLAFAAANAALGNPPGHPAIEVSRGGLELDCLEGDVTFALAGGGFTLELDGRRTGAWTVATLRAGSRLAIRPGHWGGWTYLALAAHLPANIWLGSASTHALSGLGGGRIETGSLLELSGTEIRTGREGPIPCPVSARPRRQAHVVLGPQDRFFTSAAIDSFQHAAFRLTGAYDRMGVRLDGPALHPQGPLDMPSEPLSRGAVQVAGDGVATVLLADHQTTGGYPKIAAMLDCDTDGFAQLRPRDFVRFITITPQQAITRARVHAEAAARYLAAVARQWA